MSIQLSESTDKYVYPEFISKGEVYAEDIEQAILDYLGLEDAGMEFQTFDGKWHTTKVLKIRIRGI